MPGHAAFYDLVVEEWRRRGVGLMPPISEVDIADLFNDLGCMVSADVKAFYARVGGSAISTVRMVSGNSGRRRRSVGRIGR